MKVRPLPFQTVAEFVPSYSVDDVFLGYAVLGGIPYFWQGVNPQRSMTENLAANILRSNGFLNDEAQSALRQEFRDPATYNAILQTIELRSSLRNFESQNEYGYKPCIKRRFQNAETLQSRNQKNSS